MPIERVKPFTPAPGNYRAGREGNDQIRNQTSLSESVPLRSPYSSYHDESGADDSYYQQRPDHTREDDFPEPQGRHSLPEGHQDYKKAMTIAGTKPSHEPHVGEDHSYADVHHPYSAASSPSRQYHSAPTSPPPGTPGGSSGYANYHKPRVMLGAPRGFEHRGPYPSRGVGRPFGPPLLMRGPRLPFHGPRIRPDNWDYNSYEKRPIPPPPPPGEQYRHYDREPYHRHPRPPPPPPRHLRPPPPDYDYHYEYY